MYSKLHVQGSSAYFNNRKQWKTTSIFNIKDNYKLLLKTQWRLLTWNNVHNILLWESRIWSGMWIVNHQHMLLLLKKFVYTIWKGTVPYKVVDFYMSFKNCSSLPSRFSYRACIQKCSLLVCLLQMLSLVCKVLAIFYYWPGTIKIILRIEKLFICLKVRPCRNYEIVCLSQVIFFFFLVG